LTSFQVATIIQAQPQYGGLKIDIKQYIRDVPDFPSPGILYKDITPLLGDADAFAYAIDLLAERYESNEIDAIVGIEARGFLFAAPLAVKLGAPMVPVRKKGKLPFHTHSVEYALEYGTDVVEMHIDAVTAGRRVLVIDDVIATAGTLAASLKLIEQAGGEIVGCAVVVELTDLAGRDALAGYDLHSLIQY
tara:strand:+ start:3568 stop:4140 length:573 start_codon:yes stop_codon:yes gene_type:complete